MRLSLISLARRMDVIYWFQRHTFVFISKNPTSVHRLIRVLPVNIESELAGPPFFRNKTRTDLWHDFSFTAKQLLSPRTSSKYHASRGVGALIIARIARMMVGNAAPFVSPARGTLGHAHGRRELRILRLVLGQWEFAQLAMNGNGLGCIRHCK